MPYLTIGVQCPMMRPLSLSLQFLHSQQRNPLLYLNHAFAPPFLLLPSHTL